MWSFVCFNMYTICGLNLMRESFKEILGKLPESSISERSQIRFLSVILSVIKFVSGLGFFLRFYLKKKKNKIEFVYIILYF